MEHTLYMMRQNGVEIVKGSPDEIRAKYLEAERIIDMRSVLKMNSMVAAFRYNEIGDLIDAYHPTET